jgi:hypothetical protein
VKHLAIAVTAAFLVGFAGPAAAHHKPGHQPPGNANGVYGCGEDEDFVKNPGHGLRSAREEFGNPNELAEFLGFDTVADLIHEFCGNPG